MSTLFTGTGYIIEFVSTLLLLPLLVYMSFLISYGIGKGLNFLFLHGRCFNASYLLSFFIGGIGFFALVVVILGASLIQVFSIAAAERWYEQLFSIGYKGNIVGITCSISAGFFKGKNDD